MPSPTEALKKELEEELKLSSEDLRSHAWYHGPLSRQEAERLLQKDGDFLIRDSLSSPGDYVLSCVSSTQVLHFKIIAVTLRPRRGFSRVLYQLEQDQFDNIPALVRSYVGDRKPLSESSRAIIVNPINRTVPLSMVRGRQDSQKANKENRRSLHLVDSSLLRNKDKFGSHPGNLDVLKEIPLQSAQSDGNLFSVISAESSGSPEEPLPIPLSPMFRTGSDPVLRAKTQPVLPLDYDGSNALRGSDSQLHSKAPPKPIRAPSLLLPDPPEESDTYSELVPRAPMTTRRYVDTLKAEEKWRNRARATETTFGFLDAEKSPDVISPGLDRNLSSSRIDNSKIVYPELNKSKVVQAEKSRTLFLESIDHSRVSHSGSQNPKISTFRISNSKVNQPIIETPEEGDDFVRPQIQTTTSFQPRTFQSILLLPDNKPLEPNTLRKLKEIVSQRDCKESALHILREDCVEIRIWEVTKEQQKSMGVRSGLELILLPYGQQLRRDLLERHHLLSLGIAVDILGCTGTVVERAHTLHRIISLAYELKEYAGDLFAFSAVMKALMLPQIARLEQTWQMLRQTHTDSAITFHKQLKPALRDMDECLTVPSPNNIVVPHILPVLKALEGEDDWGGPVEEHCGCLLRMLQAARSYAANAEVYQKNAEDKLKGFTPEPELREAFKTEFSLRMFWGSKGATVEQAERYKKFDQILNVLSQKLEPETQRNRLASSVYGSVYGQAY
ncbi:breast cancer anti-estrogen resistance protein 3 homolog [Bufo bufo]|uniref:breast cancer anti-estrogen resistance protein 3 homolog n=1 Tax=Bufo bufo TaxID=8384 RepID=UPI001ABE32C7|nr:breast cancer anti-estrogen resistance protein 3 homolog [Bufo bufo]XP_040292544.1 breast cancer anti-estrogen resistance protein 3 homolog [Bufo bufo]XP_040292545.1 breast cancer anti-estrogen resistance protein 3 homolog [Bufo bufo]